MTGHVTVGTRPLPSGRLGGEPAELTLSVGAVCPARRPWSHRPACQPLLGSLSSTVHVGTCVFPVCACVCVCATCAPICMSCVSVCTHMCAHMYMCTHLPRCTCMLCVHVCVYPCACVLHVPDCAHACVCACVRAQLGQTGCPCKGPARSPGGGSISSGEFLLLWLRGSGE